MKHQTLETYLNEFGSSGQSAFDYVGVQGKLYLDEPLVDALLVQYYPYLNAEIGCATEIRSH